jgi:formylmethanofuran dehydrogenase subunit B
MTITCPFCGLACDDLAVAGGAVDARGCGKAASGFARARAARRPHAIDGRPVDLPEAAAAAAGILRGATMPLIHGLSADVHGVRALLALADRIGAAIDHMHSAALLANTAVARASGWVAATFGEIANRADVILVIGADPQRSYPRFRERLVANPAPLYRDKAPLVAYLGPDTGTFRSAAPSLTASVESRGLLDAVGVLAAGLRGCPPRDRPGLPAAELAAIAATVRTARYGAIVWDLTGFAPGEAELAVELIAATLRDLNAKTRCVGLPFGGSDNGLGAMQSALWQAGWPLRLGFGEGGPHHDPWRFEGQRLLASGEADALLWVAAFAPAAPPSTDVPTIALVADDVELDSPAAVEIRVGIPGLDHGGEIVRSDAVIALPLHASLPSDRPSVAAAARAILGALGPPP